MEHSLGAIIQELAAGAVVHILTTDTHDTDIMLGSKDSIVQKDEMEHWTGFTRAKSSFMDDSDDDSEDEDEPKSNKKHKHSVGSKLNVSRKKNIKAGSHNNQNKLACEEEKGDKQQRRRVKGVTGTRKVVSNVKKEFEFPVKSDIRTHVGRRTCQDVANKVYGNESGIDAHRPLDNKLVKDIEELVKNGRATVEEFACVLGDHRRSPPFRTSKFLSEMVVNRVKSWKGSHINISIPLRYFNMANTLCRLTSLSAELSHPLLLGGSFMCRLVDVLDHQLWHVARSERINYIQSTVEVVSDDGKGSRPSIGLEDVVVEDGQLNNNDMVAANAADGEKKCNVPEWAVQGASRCGWWVESSQEAHLTWLLLKMRGLLARVQGSPQDLYRFICHFIQYSLAHTGDLRPIFALSLLETWLEVICKGLGGCSSLPVLGGFISDAILSVVIAAAQPRKQLIRNKRCKEDEASLDSVLKLCSPRTPETPENLLHVLFNSLHKRRHSASALCDLCKKDSTGNRPLDKGLEEDGFEALELICMWLQATLEEQNHMSELLEEAAEIATDRNICTQLRRIAIIAIGAIGTASMHDNQVKNTYQLAVQKLEEVESLARDYGVNGLPLQSTAKTYLFMLSGNVLKGGNRSSELEWIQNIGSSDRYNLSQRYLTLVQTMKALPCVHVINLKRREDRMIHMKAQAKSERFLITRVDAVDGREVVVSPDKVAMQWDTEINSIYEKTCLQRTIVDLTPGERACAASHLDVWQRHTKGELEPFIASREDVVLILEDDALLEPDFIHSVKSLLENLPKTFDICLLGYRLPKEVEESASHHLSKLGLPKLGTNLKKGKSHLYARVEYAWQLHAYLLNRRGADKLCGDEVLPIFAPADIFVASLMRSKKIQGLICNSQLCTQDVRLVNTPLDVQSIGLKKM